MILIITNKDDFTADFIIDKLNERKLPYYRLNCEDLPNLNYSYSSSQHSEIVFNGISGYSSIWLRRTRLPDFKHSELTPSEIINITYEFDALLHNFLQTVVAKNWLSHPDAIKKAENKIFQLRLASRLGFCIPETLITNDRGELRSFALQFGSIIIKPLKNGRIRDVEEDRLIYTNQLDGTYINNLDDYQLTPVIYQQQIEKDYELRVTVVGDSVFAAKVDSQSDPQTKVDWRKKKLKFSAYQLPENMVNLCKRLVQALHLAFGAIDLIRATDGNYYFLEINPNGQWAWIEMDTKLPIADCIIKYLTTAC